jgi:signal transduction histidine kinase
MQTFATGAAFVDGSGAVLAADDGFAAALALPPGDCAAALRDRCAAVPALRALLDGAGPAVAEVPGADGELVEISRIPAGDGALLVARIPGSGEWLEQAVRSQGLTRLAAGLAHDVKNPLNAMALQLALLTDKLSALPDAATASASHLAAVREQIGRVNEVVRRFLDVADPSSPLGYTDLGALVADTASLFGHDARRRRVDLRADAVPGTVRAGAEAGRVARLVLGLLARGLAGTPEGGKLTVRARTEGDQALVEVEHTPGAADGETRYYTGVIGAAASALGGALVSGRDGEAVRLTLRLPRNERT